MARYTNSERIFLTILSDGRQHTLNELLEALGEDAESIMNVRVHISKLRKKLRASSMGIICEPMGNDSSYRLVQYLASPYDPYAG